MERQFVYISYSFPNEWRCYYRQPEAVESLFLHWCIHSTISNANIQSICLLIFIVFNSFSILFWTDRSTIHIQSLSGVDLGVCHSPLTGAQLLAVDIQRRHLFWLSSYSGPNASISVSQMEYTIRGCNSERYACMLGNAILIFWRVHFLTLLSLILQIIGQVDLR